LTFNFGKILIVDNEFDETIEKAVKTLVKDGVTVQYWNGDGKLPSTIENVRIIILDLDLRKRNQEEEIESIGRTPGYTHYALAIKALNEIRGPYLVIIMAHDFIPKDDPKNLREAFKEAFGKPICGIVSDEGLTKAEELKNPEKLNEIITKSVTNSDILKMVFLWEDIIDTSTDLALNDLVEKDFEPAISRITKVFCKEMGDDAASRELIDLLMQLVSRNVKVGKPFNEFKQLVGVENKKSNLPLAPADAKALFNKIMFYNSAGEMPWTGDIYQVKGSANRDYAIIINSPCDLAQKNAWAYRVCFGFLVDKTRFDNLDYAPYKIDPKLVKRRKDNPGEPLEDFKQFAKARYSNNSDLTESLYLLHNAGEKDPFMSLCFDFNDVTSVSEEKLNEWIRICRLDSPFVEHMLQRYASNAFRIGLMPINEYL
jgi:hypothetical protein